MCSTSVPVPDLPASPDLPAVTIVDGRPMTSSLDVAAKFGKRHDNVLRVIQTHFNALNFEGVDEFNRRNFMLVDYRDAKGERHPMYHLTRDAFSFLVMSFTGAAAALWKIRYINAFNAMEAELRRQAEEARKPLRLPSDAAFEAGKLAVAFARLTPERVRLIRDVLFWREERWSYQAIAGLLHVSVGTVRYIARRYYHDKISLALYALDRLQRRAVA